jgi:hypothetical protein
VLIVFLGQCRSPFLGGHPGGEYQGDEHRVPPIIKIKVRGQILTCCK